MYLVYGDESKDATAGLDIFSLVLVKDTDWKSAFSVLKQYRGELRKKHGIFLRKELHARHFATGRGRYSVDPHSLELRHTLFHQSLAYFAKYLPVTLIHCKFHLHNEMRALERTMNRINAAAKADNGHALIYWDEGKEAAYTKLLRKVRAFNMIESKFGQWEPGVRAKNIPAEYILEDPVFRASEHSTFIQVADFAAYALLRREVPLNSKRQTGLNQAFDRLKPICSTKAFAKHPEGIITDE